MASIETGDECFGCGQPQRHLIRCDGCRDRLCDACWTRNGLGTDTLCPACYERGRSDVRADFCDDHDPRRLD